MATVKEMIYDFKLEAEQIDNKSVEGLTLPQIISLLNKGMLLLMKRRYGLDPTRRESFESTERRTQELQKLHVLLEPLERSRKKENHYFFDCTKTKERFLFLTRIAFFGSKETCKNQKLKAIRTQTDDLAIAEENPHRRSSFEWRQVNYRFGGDMILADTDGSFDITKAELDYLRYPKEMDVAGYKRFDGKASTDINCELPVFIHDDIVSSAVLLFKVWRASTQDAQAAMLAFTLNE